MNKYADWLGVDYFDMVLLNPSDYRAVQGALHAKKMLLSGFVTIRHAGNPVAYVDVDVKRTINEGLIPGPTMVVVGKIIAPLGQKTRGELAIGYITSFVEAGIPNADILAH